MAIYTKLDDLTNLTAAELVDEIYRDDPDLVFDVIKKNRIAPLDETTTKSAALATFIAQHGLDADDVVDGYVEAAVAEAAERGTALRSILASAFEAAGDLEDTHEAERTLMLAFGDNRFSDVVVATVLWEAYSFRDLAALLRVLLDKLEQHCDDADALALLRLPPKR